VAGGGAAGLVTQTSRVPHLLSVSKQLELHQLKRLPAHPLLPPEFLFVTESLAEGGARSRRLSASMVADCIACSDLESQIVFWLSGLRVAYAIHEGL